MTHHTVTERAMFEEFASVNGKRPELVARNQAGKYLRLDTATGWMWWQAARRAPTVPPITASLMVDDGGERPAYCVMAAYTSEKDARNALARLTAASQPPEAVQLDEIKAAWNAQADEFNQWGELGEDEKVEWAAIHAAATAQRKPLSDEYIRALYDEESHWDMVAPYVIAFARSIEAAHDIT